MKPRILSTSRSLFPTVMTIAGLALAAPSASASDGTWDGGYATTSIWNNGNNWVGNATPTFNSTSIITFYAVGASRLTNNYIGANRTIGSLIFNDDADSTVAIKLSTAGTSASGKNANLTFGGAGAPGSITITAGAAGSFTIGASGDAFDGNIVLANNLTVAHDGTGTLTLSRPVAGVFDLTKTGTGSLILSAANTYRGATTISYGLLTLGNELALQNSALDTSASILGTATSGLKTTATTLTLGSLTGGKNLASVFTTTSGGYSGVTALTLNPGSGVTNSYSGAIANGAVNMTLRKDGAGTQILSGTSSYSGATTISAGVLEVCVLANGGNDSSIGSSAATGTNLVFLGGSSFGTLRYIGDVDVVTNRAFQYSSGIGGGATIESSGVGTLSFDTPGTGIISNTFGEIRSLVLGGTNTGANTFGKIIANNGSGATSLTKNGDGTWILDQTNTFTGATTVSGGTLTLNNSLALQNSALDTTNSIAGTATGGLKTTVTTLTFGGLTGDKNLASVFTTTSGGFSEVTSLTLKSGVGSSSYSGAIADGAINMNLTKNGAGTQTLSGANSYTGLTIVNQGTLTLENDQSAATGGFNVGSTTASANPILNIGTGATTTVAVASGNVFQIGTNATNGIDAVVNVADLATVTSAGSLTIGRRGTLNVNSGATWNQAGDLTVQGWGNVDTSVQGQAVLTVGSGGIFNYTGANTIKLPVAGGTGTFSGNNPGIIIEGTFSTAMGFESIQTQSGASSTTNGLTIDGGTLKFTASMADIATATGPGATFPILVTLTNAANIDTQANNVGSSSNIGGTGSLTKLGGGTLSLTGTNTYTGSTVVDAGKLVVGVASIGSITSNVSVAAGAILGGSGTITGNVTLATNVGATPGGQLTVGNSPGVMTVVGTSNFNSGSIFSWDLTDNVDTGRGPKYDGLTSTDLTVASGAIFQVVLDGSVDRGDAFWNSTQNWTDIFSVSGTTTLAGVGTLFDTFQILDNTTGSLFTPVNGSFSFTGIGGTTLTWSAVPEPTTALAGILLGVGLLRRRRRA